jgi:DNA-binding CsgD family transcriptional regulator
MSKSQIIGLADVRQIFGLLGEIRELGGDPAAWRLHLISGLTALLGAQVGLTGEMELPYTLDRMRPANPVDFGWRGDQERATWREYFSHLDISDDPTWQVIYPHVGRPLTKFRDQFMSPAQWYRCEHVQRYRRTSGVDSFIISQRPLPWMNRDHIIYMLRGWNEPPLSLRRWRIVELFHNELAIMLHCDVHNVSTDPCLAALSPRLRQTLHLLLAGHAEKQIARSLAISRHTVHQYITSLYQRMRVCSRAELLAKLLAKPPVGRMTFDIPGLPRVPPAQRRTYREPVIGAHTPGIGDMSRQ